MVDYSAVVQLNDRYTDHAARELIGDLFGHQPVAHRGRDDHLEVVFTTRAATLRQAVFAALSIVNATGHDPRAIEVLPIERLSLRLDRNGLR